LFDPDDPADKNDVPLREGDLKSNRQNAPFDKYPNSYDNGKLFSESLQFEAENINLSWNSKPSEGSMIKFPLCGDELM
jgi:hypothetical protein